MMKVRRAVRTVLSLLLVSLLAACSAQVPASPPASQASGQTGSAPTVVEPATLRLGVMAISDCIQAFVAQEKGFFAEQNLTVEMQTMKGGAEIAPAVAGGSLDAGWSNIVSIALAHARGIDFVFMTPGILEKDGHRPHRIMVAADSPIQSLKDLVGKTFAVNTLDNIPYLASAKTLKKAGVDPAKVQFVEVPFPTMLAALKEGKVQAAIMAEPFNTVGTMEGSIRVLDPEPMASFGERTFVASWFASEKWLKENADVAGRFNAALSQAKTFMDENPAEAMKIMLKYTKLDENIGSKMSIGAFEGQVQLPDMQSVIDSAVEFGLLEKSFPASEILREQ